MFYVRIIHRSDPRWVLFSLCRFEVLLFGPLLHYMKVICIMDEMELEGCQKLVCREEANGLCDYILEDWKK